MELSKNRYKKEEVEKLLNNQACEYESKLAEKKERISELVDSENHLKSELDGYKKKEEKISRALKDAENKAIELEQKAHEQYVLTIEKLKKFSTRWDAYFNELKEKYPLYPAVKSAVELKEKMEKLLGKMVAEKTVVQIDSILDKNSEKFNPKKKIEEYVSATSDNGFNLDEVLNPGELQLEDLCKELGLIDE